MTNLTKITLSAVTIALLSGCGDTTINQAPSTVTITGDTIGDTITTSAANDSGEEVAADSIIKDTSSLKQETLSGNIDKDMTLTSDTVWTLDGLVVVESGVTLTIEPGTIVAGLDGTGDATSYMIVDKNAKLIAEGTKEDPIIFTSTKRLANPTSAEVGQWGGLTIIGNAGNDQVQPYEVNSAFTAGTSNPNDSSGILRNVYILNSGITMEQDKEINGLSFVGVGSGTIVENITVDYSDDDGIEVWGGTVNMTNITVSNCTDDYFDIDDGYSGTVKNLVINTTTGNAGIEMSGNTAATFDGFSITTGATQKKEGAIYFKKDGIGGHFKNGTIVHNGGQLEAHGAIHSKGTAAIDTVSFENVSVTSPDGLFFTGDSKDALESKFNSGTGNTLAN